MRLGRCAAWIGALLLAFSSTSYADVGEDIKLFNEGSKITWNSPDQENAHGMKFSFDYPSSWQPKVIPDQDLRVSFSRKSGIASEQIDFQVLKVPEEKTKKFLSKEVKKALVSYDTVKALLPVGANIVAYHQAELDSEPCALVEYTEFAQRDGVTIQQRSIFLLIPHTQAWLIANAAVGVQSSATPALLEQRFNEAKPLFHVLFKSIKMLDVWEKP